MTVNAGVTVSGQVVGSKKGDDDDVTNNKVIINGTARDVYGGLSTWTGEANKNKVTISGGTVNGVVYGGKSALDGVVENTVEISDGTIKNSVWGGYTDSGEADKNTIEISGGTIGTYETSKVYGGRGSWSASENKVTISGGTLTGQVCGGYADAYNDVKATDNTVTISGGTINGDVIGGQLEQVVGVAQNNTVNILTQIAVQGLYGGIADTSSGNTLNLAAKGVTATDVGYFQNLNFYLPTDMTKSDIMLTINGTANVDGATVGVLAQGTLTKLKNGDTITLLKANTLSGTITPGTIATAKIPTGITTVDTYTFNIVQDDNAKAITATVDGISTPGGGDNNSDSVTNELQANTKSMVETRAASTTILNAGADMLAGQGFQQAANAIAQAAESGDGQSTAGSMTPFVAIGTGSLRAESGSYVDAKSWAINVGFAKEINNRQGKLLFGPLVEYGRGSYDSYLDNGTHGEGNSSYWGLGKISKISADDQLDCYVKYFYSRQSGDNVTMHAAGVPDEVYNFDSVSSHRLRLGTRLTHKLNKQSSLYGGVAYQYEFDGDARATYNGNSTPSPSVKGGSGMFELGWQVKPDASPLTLDLSLTAWAGKQRGLTGQLGMNWKF